jgi:outer membrane receptor for ferrienterochelin and colicin
MMSLLTGRTGWRRGLALTTSLGCWLFAASHSLWPAERSLSDLSLEELLNVEVVYGAARHEQSIRRAPASVTIISSEDIRRYGYRTLADIVRSVRGFYATYDRNYSFIGTRGFLRPGDFDTRLLVLIDGHRLNENVYGAAYSGTEQMMDVELIDQVEVIRGPSSSIYGTSAFFAVINVVTRTAGASPETAVSAAGASYGTRQTRVEHTRTTSNGTGLLLSGSWYGSSGQQLFFKEFDTPANGNGLVRDDDDEYYRLFAKVTRGDFTVEAGDAHRVKGIPTASFGTIFGDTRAQTTDVRSYAFVKYAHVLPSQAGIQVRLYNDRYYYRGEYPYDYPPVTMLVDPSHGYWWGVEASGTTRTLARQKLTFGGEYRRNTRQDINVYDLDPRFVYADERHSSIEPGIYIQDEITASKKMTLDLGLRYDRYETFGGTTNPRLALIWSPGDATTAKFLYGTAFRTPTTDERFYNFPGVFQGNPDLKAETVRTMEVELERLLGGSALISGSVYRYYISNLISLVPDPGGGVIWENSDRVGGDGAEVELENKWSRALDLKFSYAYQRTAYKGDDAALSNSPKHLAKLNLGFPIAGERLTGGFELQYTSSRLTVQDTVDPGFTIANLTFESRKLAPGLDLSASVYNLFDKSYGDPGSTEHVEPIIIQNGRNYRLLLTWRF